MRAPIVPPAGALLGSADPAKSQLSMTAKDMAREVVIDRIPVWQSKQAVTGMF